MKNGLELVRAILAIGEGPKYQLWRGFNSLGVGGLKFYIFAEGCADETVSYSRKGAQALPVAWAFVTCWTSAVLGLLSSENSTLGVLVLGCYWQFGNFKDASWVLQLNAAVVV